LKIFVATRPFTDEHKFGARIADAKYDMGATRTQLATLAIADGRAQVLEAVGLQGSLVVGEQIDSGATEGTVCFCFFDDNRFDFGRFGFWQGTNSRALALPQMTPERRCQRGKFRRVTIVGH
jgi:hypothetical protein